MGRLTAILGYILYRVTKAVYDVWFCVAHVCQFIPVTCNLLHIIVSPTWGVTALTCTIINEDCITTVN